MAVDLKLGDRLAIIRDGVKKGLTPQQAMLQYQINKDGGYNNWKNQFKQSTGVDPDLDGTYNYELFFKENPEAAKQLLLGKVSPDILKMYKTPLAIQREKQVLLQRQKGNINSLMDYSLYEKLINDYMNKSVNVSAYGGNINMFVNGGETASESASTTNKDDNEITKHERFTETELEPNKWRTQRLPDFIELTPEELQDIKNYVLEMAYKEDTNRPFRIFNIPKEVIVKYHPELENVSMQNPGFYIYEDEYQDALKNGKKYLRLKWLRQSSKEGKLYDEWKKLRKMLYLYDTDRNYANFTDGDTLELEDNAEKNYNLLPNVVATYDKGTQQQILPQEEPEELEIEPIRSGSVAIEPDITKIVQVKDRKLPPLTPTENTLKYIDMSGTTGEELKAFNNNPLNTEGVPGGSSFGNSADGTRIPDVFNLYENYNYNVPYEDFSTYQPEGYQHQPWNIYNLPPSGYVDMPNWNVQQIQDNGDDDKFLNFLNMLANIPQKSDNTDLLMTLLMLPKDYFADPYAGEHYTNTANFYDAYNNDPYTKIQRESNGTPLYKSGGRINKFEVGGEPSIEELALQRALLATSPKSNYHKAIDFVYDPMSAMKMAYDKGLSNCTLTASLFYDPEKPITKARTIVTTPHVSGFYEVGEDYAVPGSMVIASLPNGNDYGKNSYHTMILSGYADQDYQFPFKGKVYDVKKGEPLVNYSKGKREPENYIKNIPLKAYLDNSDGKTNVRYYRPYNNDLKAKLLPEITVTPEGNYILDYLNKNVNILAKGRRINKFDGYGPSYIQTPWNDPWKENHIGKQVAENNARQLLLFQLLLDEYAKRLNEYINAYKNWEYKDIEGEYPIATNVWTNNGRIPIYKISGRNILKAFPDYTWNNGLTFDPNVNYYTIKNTKGLYALIPQGSYISGLMDLSFERDKTLHPTNIAASDMTTLVANVPTLYGIKQMPPKQPEELETAQQALLWLDNRSNWERQQAQNMYDLNAWQQRYNYWLNIENTTRDMITRSFMPTNYIRATGDAINGDDGWFGSFFDPDKHGMWFGPRGRAFLLNHPFASGLLDLGVDILGAKTIKPISNFASNVRGFRTPSITRNPNYYYRQGVGLIEDARQSGVIRAGVNPLTGRLDFQFPFFQKGTLHYGDSKWAPDIILNKGKGNFEWQPVNSVGFVKPGQLDYNMRTPLVNGQTNMADASLFSTLKPVRFGKRTIGYIEKPLMKNNNTFTPTLNSTDLRQSSFTYDPILGYRYTGFKLPTEFGTTFNAPVRVSVGSGPNKPTFKERLENALNRYFFIENENSYTRGIGMGTEGIEDAFKTGVFRGNPRGTELNAKQFTKAFEKNKANFRDIVEDTGIKGIESKFQSRTLTEEEFNALKQSAEKIKKKENISTNKNSNSISLLRIDPDRLYAYDTYADYIADVNKTIAKVEEMPNRIASGEIKINPNQIGYKTEEGITLPTYQPIEERFSMNSDYVADGLPLSYWYGDGRNPITKGHSYARSNYGVRVNNPETYTPFFHYLHEHPSFLTTPKLIDPSVELFGKGPFGITLKLDKITGKPLIEEDLKKLFKRKKGKRK